MLERGYDVRGVFGVANQGPEDAAMLASAIDKESWVDTKAVMAGTPIEMGSALVGSTVNAARENAYFLGASGEYFSLVRLPLLRGRVFTELEGARRAPVVIVSDLTARRLWPGEDPVGKTLLIEPGSQNSYRKPQFAQATSVGVCRDSTVRAKDGAPRPAFYFPETLRRGTMIAVRGRGAPEDTAKRLEAALARTPGSAHGARVVALQEVLDWDTYPQRAAAWLSSILGVVAFLLTMTGIYGVMSYAVNQRTKEIGIRMALGASPGSIARMVVTYSLWMTGGGLALGAVLALGVLQYAASKADLAIDMYDVPAYLASLLAVAGAGLIAALVPARVASGVDPQEAVRAD